MNICIIGGTGTIGKALIERIYKKLNITVYSRDENKQNIMRRKYPYINYQLGDIRDYRRTSEVIKGHDIVYHLAAMKHVRTGETLPVESVKTNIMGTENIIRACERHKAKLIYMSTDKSVYPINVYGSTKMIAERLVKNCKAEYVIIRSGNLFMSSGSAIPWFIELKAQGKKVHLTDIKMQRYFISRKKIAEILVDAIEQLNCILIPKMKLYKMIDIIKYLECDYKIIGAQPGEKLIENLYWDHEIEDIRERDKYYII